MAEAAVMQSRRMTTAEFKDKFYQWGLSVNMPKKDIWGRIDDFGMLYQRELVSRGADHAEHWLFQQYVLFTMRFGQPLPANQKPLPEGEESE